jgi:predicted PurR-regulated permease PerM
MAGLEPANANPDSVASNGNADDRVDVDIDARELSGVFAVPDWLRGAGQTSWLLVGLTLLLVGTIWLLSLTHVIVLPVLTAGIVAAVASPLVAWMHRHGIPRGLGTALLMLAIIAIAVGMTVVVVGGIVGEATSAESNLSDAQDKIVGWLDDIGVDPGAAEDARDKTSSATTASPRCFTALRADSARSPRSSSSSLWPHSASSSCSRTVRRSAPGPSGTSGCRLALRR